MSCDGFYGVEDPHHPRHEWNTGMLFIGIFLFGVLGTSVIVFFGG